jgi:hypothetical protein
VQSDRSWTAPIAEGRTDVSNSPRPRHENRLLEEKDLSETAIALPSQTREQRQATRRLSGAEDGSSSGRSERGDLYSGAGSPSGAAVFVSGGSAGCASSCDCGSHLAGQSKARGGSACALPGHDESTGE